VDSDIQGETKPVILGGILDDVVEEGAVGLNGFELEVEDKGDGEGEGLEKAGAGSNEGLGAILSVGCCLGSDADDGELEVPKSVFLPNGEGAPKENNGLAVPVVVGGSFSLSTFNDPDDVGAPNENNGLAGAGDAVGVV